MIVKKAVARVFSSFTGHKSALFMDRYLEPESVLKDLCSMAFTFSNQTTENVQPSFEANSEN